jgi:hypothetical protein
LHVLSQGLAHARVISCFCMFAPSMNGYASVQLSSLL